MNLNQLDQRERALKEAKQLCDELHKLLIDNVLEGGSVTITKTTAADFYSNGEVITIHVRGPYYHKADVRYSQ